jgi:hypothetical protein
MGYSGDYEEGHMKTSEFPSELEKALRDESVAEIDRWLRGYKDLQREMGLKVVYLARYFESIPEELKPKYLEALLCALESVPRDVRISTTTTLSERLMELAQSVRDEKLKARLNDALQRYIAA